MRYVGILKHLLFFCGHCNKNVAVKKNDLHWQGMSQDCDRCGNHGEVKVNFVCPKCNNRTEIELNSW
jgi:predicted RNA-binding Zn-ribbon protein involved in translation (DUF1610 family)